MRRISCLFVGLLLFSSQQSLADYITIDTVSVGNAGNAPDQGGTGAVSYDFQMGKYEVTVGQYAAFLNAVAQTDTYGLYNPQMTSNLNVAGISRSGSSGSYSYGVIGSANKPVTYVSWGDAARFANWLNNGQPIGTQDSSTTEDGAYTLNGATTQIALWNVVRNPDATWFLPSADEWYKSAFHKNDGVTGNYWNYPTSSDTAPSSVPPPGTSAPDPSATANFYTNAGYAMTGSTVLLPTQNYLSDVGSYLDAASPYGAFDQGGNVWEWTDFRTTGFEGGIVYLRGASGGSWYQSSIYLSSDMGGMNFGRPEVEDFVTGFRVATVPEPSSWLLAGLGMSAIALYRRRAAPFHGKA